MTMSLFANLLMSPVVKKNYNLLTFLKVMSEYRVASFYMYLTSAF